MTAFGSRERAGMSMKCNHCGSKIQEGASFCVQCGQPIEAAGSRHPVDEQPAKHPGSRRWIWLVIGISIGAVLGVGALLLTRAFGILPAAGLDQTDQPQASPTSEWQRPWPGASFEPLAVPEEVWLALSGFEVQYQEQPLSFDPGVMKGGVQDDDYVSFLGTGNWEDSWIGMPGFSEGDAIMVRFRFGEGAHFSMGFRAGDWDSPEAYQFAFTSDTSIQLVERGENLPRRDFYGNLNLEPDTWYHAMLGLEPQGNFFMLVWDQDNRMVLDYHEYSEAWRGLDWAFHLGLFMGWVDVSRMDVYSFSDVRIQPSTVDWTGTWSMVGIGGDIDGHRIYQSNGRVTVELNLEGSGVYIFDGTSLEWIDDAGERIDIMRGAYLIYYDDSVPGSPPGWTAVELWLHPDGERISGSTHAGFIPICLKRDGVPDYPTTCYWYYYDWWACREANDNDSDACGTYGEMADAGLLDSWK